MQIEAKLPNPWRQFSFPLSDRKRKMPPSISLALSRQINSLFALGVTSRTGGQEVFCTEEAAWQALCMHCEFYIVFNRSGKTFYQVPDFFFSHRGEKQRQNNAGGRTKNLFLLCSVAGRRSQAMSMCGEAISSCQLHGSIQIKNRKTKEKKGDKYKLWPKIIYTW